MGLAESAPLAGRGTWTISKRRSARWKATADKCERSFECANILERDSQEIVHFPIYEREKSDAEGRRIRVWGQVGKKGGGTRLVESTAAAILRRGAVTHSKQNDGTYIHIYGGLRFPSS